MTKRRACAHETCVLAAIAALEARVTVSYLVNVQIRVICALGKFYYKIIASVSGADTYYFFFDQLRRSTMPSQSSARGSAEDRKQILEGMKEEEEHSPNLI